MSSFTDEEGYHRSAVISIRLPLDIYKWVNSIGGGAYLKDLLKAIWLHSSADSGQCVIPTSAGGQPIPLKATSIPGPGRPLGCKAPWKRKDGSVVKNTEKKKIMKKKMSSDSKKPRFKKEGS